MNERYRPSPQEANNKPADVKVAEFGKTIDKIQIGAGAVMLFFPPTAALGLGFIAWNGAQHYAADRYIKWRMKNKQPQAVSQAA